MASACRVTVELAVWRAVNAEQVGIFLVHFGLPHSVAREEATCEVVNAQLALLWISVFVLLGENLWRGQYPVGEAPFDAQTPSTNSQIIAIRPSDQTIDRRMA